MPEHYINHKYSLSDLKNAYEKYKKVKKGGARHSRGRDLDEFDEHEPQHEERDWADIVGAESEEEEDLYPQHTGPDEEPPPLEIAPHRPIAANKDFVETHPLPQFLKSFAPTRKIIEVYEKGEKTQENYDIMTRALLSVMASYPKEKIFESLNKKNTTSYDPREEIAINHMVRKQIALNNEHQHKVPDMLTKDGYVWHPTGNMRYFENVHAIAEAIKQQQELNILSKDTHRHLTNLHLWLDLVWKDMEQVKDWREKLMLLTHHNMTNGINKDKETAFITLQKDLARDYPDLIHMTDSYSEILTKLTSKYLSLHDHYNEMILNIQSTKGLESRQEQGNTFATELFQIHRKQFIETIKNFVANNQDKITEEQKVIIHQHISSPFEMEGELFGYFSLVSKLNKKLEIDQDRNIFNFIFNMYTHMDLSIQQKGKKLLGDAKIRDFIRLAKKEGNESLALNLASMLIHPTHDDDMPLWDYENLKNHLKVSYSHDEDPVAYNKFSNNKIVGNSAFAFFKNLLSKMLANMKIGNQVSADDVQKLSEYRSFLDKEIKERLRENPRDPQSAAFLNSNLGSFTSGVISEYFGPKVSLLNQGQPEIPTTDMSVAVGTHELSDYFDSTLGDGNIIATPPQAPGQTLENTLEVSGANPNPTESNESHKYYPLIIRQHNREIKQKEVPVGVFEPENMQLTKKREDYMDSGELVTELPEMIDEDRLKKISEEFIDWYGDLKWIRIFAARHPYVFNTNMDIWLGRSMYANLSDEEKDRLKGRIQDYIVMHGKAEEPAALEKSFTGRAYDKAVEIKKTIVKFMEDQGIKVSEPVVRNFAMPAIRKALRAANIEDPNDIKAELIYYAAKEAYLYVNPPTAQEKTYPQIGNTTTSKEHLVGGGLKSPLEHIGHLPSKSHKVLSNIDPSLLQQREPHSSLDSVLGAIAKNRHLKKRIFEKENRDMVDLNAAPQHRKKFINVLRENYDVKPLPGIRGEGLEEQLSSHEAIRAAHEQNDHHLKHMKATSAHTHVSLPNNLLPLINLLNLPRSLPTSAKCDEHSGLNCNCGRSSDLYVHDNDPEDITCANCLGKGLTSKRNLVSHLNLKPIETSEHPLHKRSVAAGQHNKFMSEMSKHKTSNLLERFQENTYTKNFLTLWDSSYVMNRPLVKGDFNKLVQALGYWLYSPHTSKTFKHNLNVLMIKYLKSVDPQDKLQKEAVPLHFLNFKELSELIKEKPGVLKTIIVD